MNEDIYSLLSAIESLRIELDEMRKERDEARREICDMNHMTGFLSGDYALSRGWDCFKNGYPKELSEEAIKFRNIWNAYSDKLREERDEARREVCRKQKRSVVFEEAFAEAKRRGWDCFKEDT